jgi:hypothetical protein
MTKQGNSHARGMFIEVAQNLDKAPGRKAAYTRQHWAAADFAVQ